MKKRFFAIVLALTLLFAVGCKNNGEEVPHADAETLGNTDASLAEASAGFNPAQHLIGMLVADNGTLNTYLEMHGFLRTAENLGYAARLFRYTGTNAKKTVEEAVKAGCEGLVVYDPSSTATKEAMEYAKQQGVLIVSSYYASMNANASVAVDQTEYLEEVARSIAERMSERSLKTGKILIYGYNGQNMNTACEEFQKAIAAYYPGYTVEHFERGPIGTPVETDVENLANYIYFNRDIKGMFCIDEDGSALAVKAREQAQKMFKGSLATPVPTPQPTPDPTGVTPVPVNENLLKEILISVFGTGITDENIKLMEQNDIYAMISEPHYESAGQATMLLDKLMRGQSVAEETRMNIPIVRQDTLTKYQAVYEQVKEWFCLDNEA